MTSTRFVWVLAASLVVSGCKGADGPQGQPGTPGAKGDTGANGDQGAKGDTGLPGISVTVTALGFGSACGYGGAAISDGTTTALACTGAPGVKGDKGDQGIQGIQGVPGLPAPASPRDDPARIESGYFDYGTYLGAKVPCSPPESTATTCIAVASGPLVLTDLGVNDAGQSGTYFFLAGTTASAPRWARSFVLGAGQQVLPYLQEFASGLNYAVRSGETLFVSTPVYQFTVYHWSGFRP